jgi:hypothetical protein
MLNHPADEDLTSPPHAKTAHVGTRGDLNSSFASWLYTWGGYGGCGG